MESASLMELSIDEPRVAPVGDKSSANQEQGWKDLVKGRPILFMIVILVSLAARAEHEADHRYTLRGYVLDDTRAAIPGASISVRSDVQLLGNGKADASGYYSILVHLHDADLGRILTVQAGDDEGEVQVSLTPGDRRTPRLHHVNFVGGELIEGELRKTRVPPWLYGVVGVVVVALVLVYLEKRRKQKARLKATAEREGTTTPPKRKKRRRRKR